MAKTKSAVPADVKQQILDRIKNDGAPVLQLAQEHGIFITTTVSASKVKKNCPKKGVPAIVVKPLSALQNTCFLVYFDLPRGSS